MKFTYRTYEHILKINNQEYIFKSPKIEEYLEFEELIEEKKHVEAILLIIPNLPEEIILSDGGIEKILLSIVKLIFLSDKEKSIGTQKNQIDSKDFFFPGLIDLVCERYKQNPVNFIKETSLSQFICILKGIEWNENKTNGNIDLNTLILDEHKGVDYEDLVKNLRSQFK